MIFQPIYADSMGAKSFSLQVKTDVNIVIDPGIAVMHPSFPAGRKEKIRWREEGKKRIVEACRKANLIVISHYHHDHYIRDDLSIYDGKTIFAKNPNEYINDSQRKRAEKFFENLFNRFGINLKDIMEKAKERKYRVPALKSMEKDFGDYMQRRRKIIEDGFKWFEERAKKWNLYEKIPELNIDGTEIKFADGKNFTVGRTRIKFTPPFFHGIEFSRVGWIFATVIDYKGKKLIHTSDVNGPIIEDYAEWIVKEKPDIIFLDGPPTYMLGYMLNKINLRRAIENVIKILDESDALIIYDHHLPRERRFREHTKEVWEFAKKRGRRLFTVAEYFGEKPVVES